MELDDRRGSERFATLNFVHYVLDGCSEGDIEDMGRTIDASERGLLIQTSDPLPVGQRVSLSIGLGDNIADLSGEIVHCVDDEDGLCRSGIEFDPLDAQQLSKLRTYLAAFAASR
ncbi:MAG: hypothetical protein B6I36_01160 [Desulfobacteraceae bacterium 4572_35.1]|nr:MAG: hypothetical protein B6I36_01160 [Desulfobacteraceae bacterium 4572_35.1]